MQRWCPTCTTPSLIGFPKPFVWKENTAQVSCIPSEGLLRSWAEPTVLGAPLKRGVSGCWLTFLSPFLSAACGHYLTRVCASRLVPQASTLCDGQVGPGRGPGEPQLLCL